MIVTAVGLFALLGLRSDTSSGDEAEVVTQPLWIFFVVGPSPSAP
jgi:hypothetical protein